MKINFSKAERDIFKRKEKLSVSEHAEKHRVIVKGAKRIKWSNDITPYTVKPMDCFSDNRTRKIYLCWPPQSGKTQVALNCLQYAIDQAPGPAMYIMSSESTAKRISRRQLIPSFRASSHIKKYISKKADDTATTAITFNNGMDLMMAWATSASEMASESIQYLFLDEPGKYPDFTGREGDPFSLAEVRTNAYPDSKKIMYFSTPNTEGDIFSNALNNDVDVEYYYHAKCPFCGHLQRMEFKNIRWGETRDFKLIRRNKLAVYVCVSCEKEWNDAYRDDAVREGQWVTDSDIDNPVSVAFYLQSWYSPFISLSDVAEAFIKSLNDPIKMHAFVTQHLSEPWKHSVKNKAEDDIFMLKNSLPAGVVPEDSIALTAGIDMQKKGFWFVVRAWGKESSSHLVQHGFLNDWDDIETLVFNTEYPVENSDKTMKIARAALDTGGGLSSDDDWTRTEEAYRWLRKNGRGRIFGIKGSSSKTAPRVKQSVIDKYPNKNKPIKGGLVLRIINTFELKLLIHSKLDNFEEKPELFSLNADVGKDYVNQILSEELQKDRTGKTYWKQVKRDNHLLDCEVYAAAVADDMWTPSLKYINRKQNKVVQRTKSAGTKTKNQSTETDIRKRPDWFLNR